MDTSKEIVTSEYGKGPNNEQVFPERLEDATREKLRGNKSTMGKCSICFDVFPLWEMVERACIPCFRKLTSEPILFHKKSHN